MLSHPLFLLAQATPAIPLRFVVGQDASGQWLALDSARRTGGFFKSRADAIHFAEFETGHRADAVSVSALPLCMEF